MKRTLAVSVLLAACAAAQGQALPAKPATPAQPQPQTAGAHPETVSATDAVITVHGFCPEAKNSADCSTVINKEQFEKILSAVNQTNAPMPPVAVRNLAERYVTLMAFAYQAE